jgi:hypothetical protein
VVKKLAAAEKAAAVAAKKMAAALKAAAAAEKASAAAAQKAVLAGWPTSSVSAVDNMVVPADGTGLTAMALALAPPDPLALSVAAPAEASTGALAVVAKNTSNSSTLGEPEAPLRLAQVKQTPKHSGVAGIVQPGSAATSAGDAPLAAMQSSSALFQPAAKLPKKLAVPSVIATLPPPAQPRPGVVPPPGFTSAELLNKIVLF